MSVIIDGRTGEIIGTTERKAAKQARPAFEGKTVKGKVVRTKVIPKPNITKVNRRVTTTSSGEDPITPAELFKRLLQGTSITEMMIREAEKKLGIKIPRHRL